MKFAFVIFNNMTALDFVGLYDPLTRLKSMGFLPDLSWDVCAWTPEVIDDRGLRFGPTKVRESLAGYDWLIVPGGFGTRKLQHDTEFIDWLKTAQGAALKVSVCTGSLLLGAAGYLTGKPATTHPNAFEELKPYCAQVLDKRIVDAGEVVTGRGVTSAIDLGLYLCARAVGEEAAERIRKQMDYPYRWTVEVTA